MELEHAFQQSNFIVAFQIMIAGSLLAPAMMGEQGLPYRFVRTLASYTVSFGPVAILVYVLYKLTQIS